MRASLLALAAVLGASAALAQPAPSGGNALSAAARAESATRFNGVWTLTSPPALGTPPLKAGVMRTLAGWPASDGLKRCLPAGVPRIFLQTGGAFRIVIGGSLAAFTFEQNHLFRLVYLDAPHFEAAGPAYLGQSIGHRDGDALVIDTTGFNDQTALDNAGTPHSDQLHVVERLSVLASGMLEDRVTMTDPVTLARPWTVTLQFKRRAAPLLAEDYCLRRTGLLAAAAK